jgi:CRP-like cAMP-binding protein
MQLQREHRRHKMNNSMHSIIIEKAHLPLPVRQVAKKKFSVVDDNYFNPRPVGVIQNDLLAALSPNELALLLPHLELVHFTSGQELYGYGNKISNVYFPTTAVIGLLYVLADGGTTELGVTGHEGLLGVSVLMGENSPSIARVQCEGYAYKLNASILKEACNRHGKLQSLLMRYIQALFSQMAQNSVCGRHYSIEQQLSRWILERLDRLPSNEVKVTQEMIANMIGVRRESITEAIGKLQSQSLIQCRRGLIVVHNRQGLESHAGECYQIAKREFDMALSVTMN